MLIAAIIAEYNPFHNGHKYQIDELRKTLGDDTAIIAIMSGNFTQRGEPAIVDKLARAECAVNGGVNLVLELPFPYSMSSAELFARAGVLIAENLGVVDYLCFGSECGSINKLKRIADNASQPAFCKELNARLHSKSSSGCGYPVIFERVYREMYEEEFDADFFSPNNILAIEYLKSLASLPSRIKPITIKRFGMDYRSEVISDHTNQSATAIRHLIRNNDITAYNYVPYSTKSVLLREHELKRMPSDSGALDRAVIANFRMNPPVAECNIHDATGGLYNRLYAASMETSSISSLITATETKKFTRARICRAVWNAFFSVTSSDVKAPPAFTQVLAMDTIGRAVLKRIKKVSDFPVITKPSAYHKLDATVIRQKELSNRADSVYELTIEGSKTGYRPLKFSPFVKE